jgi:hypothetical protein
MVPALASVPKHSIAKIRNNKDFFTVPPKLSDLN